MYPYKNLENKIITVLIFSSNNMQCVNNFEIHGSILKAPNAKGIQSK